MSRGNRVWYNDNAINPPKQGCCLVSLLANTSMNSFNNGMHCIVHCITEYTMVCADHLLAQLLALKGITIIADGVWCGRDSTVQWS